ncbi:MAG: hypothetical protein ACLR06_12215 [Christensenellaceae bacterium]
MPRRDCLTATGGTLSYYGELLAKVFAAMKIKTAVCEKADALEGLKKYPKEIVYEKKKGIMLSEVAFRNIPILLKNCGMDFLS